MQIRVKTKNKVIELETVPGDSMKRVKQMIEEKEGISMKLQKLTFSEVDSKYAKKSTHCKAFFFGTGPSNDRRGVDVCYFYNSSVKELYSHAATMWHADEEKKKTGVVEPDENEPLPFSQNRRTLLAANDTLFVLIEEDYKNPDADATIRVLPRQREVKSIGSNAAANSREIATSREHLPLGWAGSTNAPCVLTTSAAASAFYILNDSKNCLLKIDTTLDKESTQLQVMQYNNTGRTSSPLPPGYYVISALGMDADGMEPLFIKVLYNENGGHFIYFRRVILNVERRDTCEIKTQLITDGEQQRKNTKYSIVSDGKQKVAISSLHVIDVYDCILYTRIYRITIPEVHRPSHPISVTFTMLYGEEWILCSEQMMGTGEHFESGKQRAVRFHPTICNDAVNAVAYGRDLYYASCDGIRVMNEGPAPLERLARTLCFANTKKSIKKNHPCMVNYPVRLFYSIISEIFN